MQSKIMYIELKTDGLRGEGRIGWVTFSKSGKSIYYDNRTLSKAAGRPLKANYFDEDSHEDFWISAPKQNGEDSLFPTIIEIDEDAREEYWRTIRKMPNKTASSQYRSPGKSKAEREILEKGLRRRQMDNGWMPN